MAFIVLPKVMSNEVKAILTRDDKLTPHVIMLRAKLRSLAFRVPASANHVGETRALIAYLPAGRNRVMLHHSAVSANAALSGAHLVFGEYTSGYPHFDPVPEKVMSEDVNIAAGGVEYFEELEDEDKALGVVYNSREDIPVYLVTSTALTNTTVIQGQLIYGQE